MLTFIKYLCGILGLFAGLTYMNRDAIAESAERILDQEKSHIPAVAQERMDQLISWLKSTDASHAASDCQRSLDSANPSLADCEKLLHQLNE